MGHRAIVAYTHEDNVSIHYSHWGAHRVELLDDLTEDTPFGSKNMEPEFLTELASVLSEIEEEDEDMQVVGGKLTEPSDPTPVNPEPSAVIETIDELPDLIDPVSHEAVYVVNTENWDVSAFVPVRVSKYAYIDEIEDDEDLPEIEDDGKFRLIEVSDGDEWVDISSLEKTIADIEEKHSDNLWQNTTIK